MFKPGRAAHPSNGIGTAPDAAGTPAGTEIDFRVGPNAMGTVAVIVSNMAAVGGNSLEISFNNGASWFRIPAAQVVTIPVAVYKCRVRGTTGATTAYAIMGVCA